MANLVFIPNATSSTSAKPQMDLADIPQDVREEVEQAYELLKTNAGRFHAKFDTVELLNQYITYVTAYCKLRPAGEIRFRKSPARNLPDNEMQFRITDVKTPAEKTTEEIRENVDAVKEAAKKTSVAK